MWFVGIGNCASENSRMKLNLVSNPTNIWEIMSMTNRIQHEQACLDLPTTLISRGRVTVTIENTQSERILHRQFSRQRTGTSADPAFIHSLALKLGDLMIPLTPETRTVITVRGKHMPFLAIYNQHGSEKRCGGPWYDYFLFWIPRAKQIWKTRGSAFWIQFYGLSGECKMRRLEKERDCALMMREKRVNRTIRPKM